MWVVVGGDGSHVREDVSSLALINLAISAALALRILCLLLWHCPVIGCEAKKK